MQDKDSTTDRHFRRRQKAALLGVHLPTVDELLRGMAFFGGDVTDDMREYAERLSRRLKKRQRPALATMVACLDEIAVEPSEDAIEFLMGTLEEAEVVEGVPVDECHLRCTVYLAWHRNAASAAAVGQRLAEMVFRDSLRARQCHGPESQRRGL